MVYLSSRDYIEEHWISILHLALLSLSFFASLFRSWSLTSRQNRVRTLKSVRVLRAKLVFLAGCFGCSLANLIVTHTFSILGQSHSFFWSDILEPFALAAMSFLTFHNHQRTRRSSTVVLLFWPAYTIQFLFCAQALSTKGASLVNLHFLLKSAVLLLGFVSFVLECLGTEEASTEHPILTANVYSRWFFTYVTPLLKRGVSQYITEADLLPLTPEDDSKNLGAKLQSARRKHKSLWVALAAAYGKTYLVAACFGIFSDLLILVQPQLLRLFLVFISSYQGAGSVGGNRSASNTSMGFLIAIVMYFTAVFQSVMLNQYSQLCSDTGMRIRAGLVSCIYKKALVLSNDERASRPTGEVVNLMAVDTNRLQDLCNYGLMIISCPLQVTIALVLLYDLLGPAMFPGVAILILSIPLNAMIARKIKLMSEQQMKNSDQRTKLMSELLANIKTIKLYAWEFAFMRKVLEVRNDLELTLLKKIGVFEALSTSLWMAIPSLVAFASFTTAALISSKPLTPDVIFPAIALFVLLQFPLAMFSVVITSFIEAYVSIERLTSFLNANELQPDARAVVKKADLQVGDEVLSIDHGEFWWSKKAKEPTLRDINLSVRMGELVGIFGRVGAGKTSLLAAVVGDMTRTNGSVLLSGTVASAPQDPWIFSASIRNNILYNHEYDETFYSLVIEACALRADLETLPNGDLTEVGEKGITLSGGQRARVSLARAVYARADLVLLDDVLAAVDMHVARHLMDNVIGPNGLLSSKARIIATNSLAYLTQFDHVLYLRQGVVVESGLVEVLLSNPESMIRKMLGHPVGGTSMPFATGRSTPPDENITLGPASTNILTAVDSVGAVFEKPNRRPSYGKAVLKNTSSSQDGGVVPKEHTEQGQVKFAVYMEYTKSASLRAFFCFLLAVFTWSATNVLANFTLRSWSEENRNMKENSLRYVVWYGLFLLLSAISGGLADVILMAYCTLRSTRYLHDSMLYAIMRAPLSFFETTPSGQIMNLFSHDIYVLDLILPRILSSFSRTFLFCVMIFGLIAWSFPHFLFVLPILGWFYFKIMAYYLATSRELKRIDAVTKSPIFAWFSESLAGASTIRSFGQLPIFITTNHRRVDFNQMAYLLSMNVDRWLGVRLDVIVVTNILIASMLSVVALITIGIDAGLVGLVLSYALNSTSDFNWMVRSASEVEQYIISAERIMHCMKTGPEAPYELEGQIDESWPSHGEIEFRNYSMRYRPELDLVLKDISLVICLSYFDTTLLLGVCGRTGAGKSSLVLAILRIIEPASGRILVDGVDITKLGLHDLRSRITIVPQSTELHSGLFRDVIDPLKVHQDAEIWAVLRQVHLKEFVECLPEGLDTTVSEAGSSLSSGQRQLLCFARAFLRKSKIIVLDEATSAVDLETDKAIQEIIRGPQFCGVTMITIAHRLNTILDSDRILVLNEGSVAELDTPANLLANPKTIFHSLASEAGLLKSSVTTDDTTHDEKP